MALTEIEVRLAYRFLLNREPESPEAVQHKMSMWSSIEELRSEIVNSHEYISQMTSLPDIIRRYYRAPAAQIDVTVPNEIRDKLLHRAMRQWEQLGEAQPYWSVLTHEKFRTENIREAEIEEFYASGKPDADLIEIFEQRSELRLKRDTCFELGCGVGRITSHLAGKFKRVIAADISPGNLQICKDYLARTNIYNVETILIRSMDDILNLEEFDLLYSFIVLQHSSPPVQKLFLEILLGKIKLEGCCLFQTPDYFEGYSFDALANLNSSEALFDTHCLPRRQVLSLIQAHGLKVLDVVPDAWLGAGLGSYTYFASRSRDISR